MHTTAREVEIAVGATAMRAHLARPAEPGRYPGVIVGFELFGLTGHIRDMTERIAELGYVAVAPDFYHRADRRIELPATPEGRTTGLDLAGGLAREDALHDVRATIDHLRGAEQVDGPLGMIGFSYGGHIAYLAATRLDLAATAAFYPGWLTGTDIGLSRPEPTLELTPGIGGRLLLLVGDDDHAVPPDDIAQVTKALTAAEVRHKIVRYPHTPHGFFCNERDTYRERPAEDAWHQVRELLAAELAR